MDIALTLSMEKSSDTYDQERGQTGSLPEENIGPATQPQRRIVMKGNWWTWSVFVLEPCNYSLESRGIIMWAPSLSDRRVGGENENQSYHPPLKKEGRKKKWSVAIFSSRGRNERKQKSEAFLPSLYLRAALISSCSFVCFSYFFFFSYPDFSVIISLQWSVCLPLPPPSLTVFQATQGNYNLKWQNGDHRHVTRSSEMKWPMKKAYAC